ncbi:hypothetical protein GFV12_05675 [Desulfurobacterium thermolithotrophum]|uniref:hypothetical protein n=1 Tax=Desulfurobacterium thermolithotrophum TaxID=64160 RepID=UPI0013D2B716|nr:hypothetical protein [Desulfurobacterium thermolithotrophum]
MKLYIIVCSPNCPRCGEGSFVFAEELEFINDSHIKVVGYFSFSEDINEYKRLKKQGVEKKTLIIPQGSYQFIEEVEIEP